MINSLFRFSSFFLHVSSWRPCCCCSLLWCPNLINFSSTAQWQPLSSGQVVFQIPCIQLKPGADLGKGISWFQETPFKYVNVLLDSSLKFRRTKYCYLCFITKLKEVPVQYLLDLKQFSGLRKCETSEASWDLALFISARP